MDRSGCHSLCGRQSALITSQMSAKIIKRLDFARMATAVSSFMIVEIISLVGSWSGYASDHTVDPTTFTSTPALQALSVYRRHNGSAEITIR